MEVVPLLVLSECLCAVLLCGVIHFSEGRSLILPI